MNILLKIILAAISVVLLLYFLVVLIVPQMIDKDYNTVSLSGPYEVSAEAAALYRSLDFIADLHCDVLLWKRDISKKHDYGHIDIPRMVEARMGLQAFTIVSKTPKNMNFDMNTGETDNITALYMAQGRPLKSWFSLKERALVQCKNLHNFATKSSGDFRVITNQTEFKQYLVDRKKSETGITAGYLGVEGMQILEGELDNVKKMYDAGIRMMAPVHFFDNELGGSAHGVSKDGLTDFGKKVIKEMEQRRMIVDLSHSAPALIDDVLAIATRPVVVSHTGVKGTCDNVRNLTDDHLIKIANTGGLVGIALFEPAVCGTDAYATAKAIKYTTNLIGVEHVALGSDFDGAFTMHFDVTGYPLLVEELMQMDYTPEEIGLIMGGNVKRFMLANLPKE
jgi:microsomal dipeptidase-like Zn-dependent dipeptidase